MEEIWKDIEGYDGYYQVSNLGRVRSLERIINGRVGNKVLKKGKIHKKHINNHGYVSIQLCKNGKISHYPVHRLVAKAFIQNPLNKKTVNHINGIKHDNTINNLEWATQREQVLHSIHVLGNKPPIPYENKNRRKKCKMLDLNNNFIMNHESIYHASLWITENTKYKKANDSHIVSVCKGKRSKAYGYKWLYG